jgi:AraC-like DNA-binding protein
MENPEYTHFSCAPQCPGVERFEATISSRSFPAHAHEGFVIGIVHRGLQELAHGGVVHHVPEGSLVFLNPDELHAVCAANPLGVTYQTLHVPADMVYALGGKTFRFSQPVQHAPQYAGKLEQLFRSLDDPTMATHRWLERLSSVLIDLMARQDSISHRDSAPLDRRIHRLIKHIGDHITSPLSLAALAKEVEMSPQHLIRSFKQAMGVTPHTYIQARRTALAKQLLRTNAPADAAFSAGFADQSHLTRWMKACYGTTPAAYRRFMETEGGQMNHPMNNHRQDTKKSCRPVKRFTTDSNVHFVQDG